MINSSLEIELPLVSVGNRWIGLLSCWDDATHAFFGLILFSSGEALGHSKPLCRLALLDNDSGGELSPTIVVGPRAAAQAECTEVNIVNHPQDVDGSDNLPKLRYFLLNESESLLNSGYSVSSATRDKGEFGERRTEYHWDSVVKILTQNRPEDDDHAQENDDTGRKGDIGDNDNIEEMDYIDWNDTSPRPPPANRSIIARNWHIWGDRWAVNVEDAYNYLPWALDRWPLEDSDDTICFDFKNRSIAAGFTVLLRPLTRSVCVAPPALAEKDDGPEFSWYGASSMVVQSGDSIRKLVRVSLKEKVVGPALIVEIDVDLTALEEHTSEH